MSEDPGSTSFDIAVVARDPKWRAAAPRATALARRAAEAVLRHASQAGEIAGAVEATVVLGDDDLVRSLNRRYRGQDKPTNVLSFGDFLRPQLAGQPHVLGDVVLARETVIREARAAGKLPADHLSHLVVHGMLHLLGHVHEEEGEARAMADLEVAILSRLGVPDPDDPRRPWRSADRRAGHG